MLRQSARLPHAAQVFDATGSKMFFQWALPDGLRPAVAEEAPFCRGAAFNVSSDGSVQLCVGTSVGKIQAS